VWCDSGVVALRVRQGASKAKEHVISILQGSTCAEWRQQDDNRAAVSKQGIGTIFEITSQHTQKETKTKTKKQKTQTQKKENRLQ
jgi:putative protein kinase ArgK-like GTPase of G3E family